VVSGALGSRGLRGLPTWSPFLQFGRPLLRTLEDAGLLLGVLKLRLQAPDLPGETGV